jgi:hypothetical protein
VCALLDHLVRRGERVGRPARRKLSRTLRTILEPAIRPLKLFRPDLCRIIGREIVVYPKLLQVMQDGGLFRGIEATERELYWAGILRKEFGGTRGASLQLPPNSHDASFDSIEAGFNLSRTVASSPQRKGDIVP